jgi:hypothetical protein
MHDFVDVIGRHAWPNFPRSNIEDFASKPADLTHASLLILVQNFDLVSLNDHLYGK